MHDFTSEDELIEFIENLTQAATQRDLISIGDDAAVVPWTKGKLVVTTDTLVEDVHFKARWVTPVFLGKKAALANISDLAAMGAIPKYALVSLSLPQNLYSQKFIAGLYEGFNEVFAPHQVRIIGGNLTKADKIHVTLTLIGACDRPLRRVGTRPGDLICVSGLLGAAAWELQQLQKGLFKQAAHLPESRVAFGRELGQKKLATACIDISDGLVLDLFRILRANQVGGLLESQLLPVAKELNAIPSWSDLVLYGGEDYELLFTAASNDIESIFRLGEKLEVPVSVIGKIDTEIEKLRLFDPQQQIKILAPRGWDHVSESSV